MVPGDNGPAWGRYYQNNWVGVCRPLPKTLTLFMIKICNFPYPIYDLTKNLTRRSLHSCLDCHYFLMVTPMAYVSQRNGRYGIYFMVTAWNALATMS